MNIKGVQYFFVGFTVLSLFVLVANSLFIYPLSDDYAYYVGQNTHGFWEFQKWHYYNWGGRYIPNAILGSFSYGGVGLWLYRAFGIMMIMGLFLSMFLFTKRVLKINEKGGGETLYVASVLFIAFLLSSYSIPQLFYWMPGSVSYNLGVICNLLIWSYIGNVHKSALQFSVVLFLIFVLNGTNEISMLLFNGSLFLILLFEKIQTGKVSRERGILMLISLVLFFIAVLAPGNDVRAENINYPNAKDFFFSITRSVNRGLIFIVERFYFLLLAVLMIIPYLHRMPTMKINIPSRLNFIVKLGCIVFPFGVLFMGIFPSYWATGMIPPQRTANVIGFFFLFSLFFSVAFYHFNFGLFRVRSAVQYAMPILLVGIFFVFPNELFLNATDLFSGKTFAYEKKMKERIAYIKNSAEQDVEVAPIPFPRGVAAMELKEDKGNYFNQSFAKYFKKRSIVLKRTNTE